MDQQPDRETLCNDAGCGWSKPHVQGVPGCRWYVEDTSPPDIRSVLDERGGRYGVFLQHADICQSIVDLMRVLPGWQRLASDQKQSLTVIADKIARILNGDPNYDDSWQDIAGYAQLILDRLHGTGIYAQLGNVQSAEHRYQSDVADHRGSPGS